MSDPIATPDELGTYLGDSNINEDRAYLLLDLAQQLCESVITPLPVGAKAVVLDVAARAFSNPTNVEAQAAGPFPVTYGSVAGGLWLTTQNKATLRRLNGSSSVFNIDVMPATAGQNLPWWDSGVVAPADWDVIP